MSHTKSTSSLLQSPLQNHSQNTMGLFDYDKFVLSTKKSKIKFDVNSRSAHPDT